MKTRVLADGVTVVGVDPRRHARTLRAAGITDPRLQHDYAQARALLAHHGTSYAQATMLLPAARRPYVWALYAFARYADEFVDSLTSPDPAGLQQWTHEFLQRSQPVLELPAEQVTYDVLADAGLDAYGRAMTHTMATWAIDPATVTAFCDSMLMDITVTHYHTYADLEKYMYGSAAVIGLQMLPLLDPRHPAAPWHAQKLGEAFQLTNFLRDVAEDLDRGRCYLPLEFLKLDGVSMEQLQRCRVLGVTPPSVRSALRRVGTLNETLYQQAEPGIAMLGPSAQVGIRCAFELYRGILTALKRNDYDVFHGRTRVSTPRRGVLVAGAIARSITAASAKPVQD